jgi:ankyrin repeat protein
MLSLAAIVLTTVLAQGGPGGPTSEIHRSKSSPSETRSKEAKRRKYRALLRAVERSDLSAVKRLIKHGVNVNGGDADDTVTPTNRPIVTAAGKGRMDLVDLLLDAGADPNACCCSCVTALHEAIRGKHAAVVGRLLQAGANPRLLYDGSKSPLEMARESGVTEIVSLLTKRLTEAD